MHPSSSHPPDPYLPYRRTLQKYPIIRRSQNNIRSGRESTSFRGHSGRGFNNGGGRYLPHQTSRPTNAVVIAPSKKSSSMAFCEICKIKVGGSHEHITAHNNEKNHKRFAELLKEIQGYKEGFRQDIQNSTGQTNDQPQSITSDLHAPASKAIEPPSTEFCKICQVKPGCLRNMLTHLKGKKHKRMLELHEELEKLKTIHRRVTPPIPNSQRTLTDRRKTIQKSEKTGCMAEKVNSEFQAGEAEGESKDDSTAQGRGLKRKISGSTGGKYMKRIQKSEKTGCMAEKVNSEFQAEKAEGESRDDSIAQGCGLKRKISGSTGGKYKKTNEGIRRLVVSSKPNLNAQSNFVEPLVPVPEVTPPPGTPLEGSSLKPKFLDVLDSQSKIHVSNGMAHQKIQNSTGERNDQPQSISVESHTPEGFSNTQTKDVSSDSATGALSPPQGPMALSPPQGPMASKVSGPPTSVGSGFKSQIQHALHTESNPQLSEAFERYESHSPTDEANVQLPSSVLVEFQDFAGDGTDNETTDGSSKAEQEIDVLAPELEPQIQNVLHTDLVEPQSSEAMTHCESQCPTDEANVSVLVEFQAPAGDSIDSETADGSSKAEQKMDVLAPELEAQSSEAMTHNEFQCPTDDANDQLPLSVLMEFQAPAGDSTHTETADGSSKAEQMMDVLAPELEPQSSEAMTHNESQCPTDEANVQLASSVLMEFQAPAGDSTDTETAVGSSKAEQKGDVLASDLGITQLSQVTICVTCGDEGFPEALVFCQKCQVYALHRYCMDGDGPVIPIDDVIWFCDDCNEEVEDTPHYQSTCLPSGTSDSLHLAEKAMQARTEITNCIQQVKEHMPLLQNITELDGHPDAQPIVDPIWRGRIYLHNGSTDIVNGVLAHLSSLACPRVMEETRLFPEMLCVELLPRSQVWPKSFMKCGPSDDNIALYFFPENERDAFDKLVDEVISLDLAMRVVIENAELLVFPSTVLPIKYQKFQAKYYLWAVFRAIQTPLTTNDAVSDKHSIRPKKTPRII